MKKIFRTLLAGLLVAEMLPLSVPAAEETVVTDGLFAHYDAAQHGDGDVWKDLSGNGYDFEIDLDDTNYWTDNSLHVDSARNYFADEIVDLVNGDAFTAEIALGELEFPGTSYISFIISDNDNFSLFLRTNGDFIEFKSAGNSRPKVADGEFYANNATVAVTFDLGGEIRMYVDGECIGVGAATEHIGADTLFLGHNDGARNWLGDVYGIRFYDRALTEKEIFQNASSDWLKYRGTALEKKAPEASGIIMTEIADSNVFTAPTLVTMVEDQADADALAKDLPNTAIFKADDSGNTLLGTASETAVFCGNVIPAFEVATEAAVKATVANLEKSKIIDYFIVAEDTKLLDLAIGESTWARTVLRVNDTYKTADGYDLMKIRGDANAVGCHVVILPEEISDRSHADYLQRRLIGVWTTAPATEYGVMKGILSGGNGLVTQDIPAAKDALKNNFETNTMTRQILVVGHRGMPSKYPENTVEGSLYAIEAGADIVENDVDITRDGVIVAMHDSSIDRTTNGRGNVASMTLEKLKGYTVNGSEDWKIPTLEEYFIEWKKLDPEKQLFVEIKSGDARLIDEFVRLVEQYDIADQVNVITFSQDQQKRLHEAFSEMSIGHLTSGILNGNTEQNLKTIIRTVQKLEGTFNHNTDGITEEYFDQLNAHGITHWPWTYNDQGRFVKDFLIGINGMTTDYAHWVSDTVKYCYTGEGLAATEITLTEGETLTDVFRTMQYDGTNAAGGEIRIVSGGDVVTAEGNTLTATAPGEAYVYASAKTTVGGKSISATSDLIKVTVQANPDKAAEAETEAPVGETPAEEETAETVAVMADAGEKGTAGTAPAAVFVFAGIAVAAVIGGVFVFRRKKKS